MLNENINEINFGLFNTDWSYGICAGTGAEKENDNANSGKYQYTG